MTVRDFSSALIFLYEKYTTKMLNVMTENVITMDSIATAIHGVSNPSDCKLWSTIVWSGVLVIVKQFVFAM